MATGIVDVTHSASIAQDRDTGLIECVVTRNILAGACGPILVFQVETRDVNAIDIELAQRGFQRIAAWRVGTSCQGMTLDVAVAAT